MIVAISGFYRVDELRRFARLRNSAILVALVALLGVLLFGVLAGLLVAVALALFELLQRLSSPPVAALGRDPSSGTWRNRDRHPDGLAPPAGTLVVAVEGPIFYANSSSAKDRILELAKVDEALATVVLDLSRNDVIDVQALDMLGELQTELAGRGVELLLASVHQQVLELLVRSASSTRVEPTIDSALATGGGRPEPR